MTTSANNAALARSVYDAFNRHDFDRALAFVSDDVEIEVYPQGFLARGVDGFRIMMERYKAP